MVHPRILKFIGEASFNSQSVIISPYMKNGHLLQYFKMHREVNKKRLILQVADGLHYLHTVQGLVHGDIKCANVLVSDARDALLADVGLSTSVEKPQSSMTTATDLRKICTLRFAAPEILQDTASQESADDAALRLRSKTCESDVYAFAMLVLEVRSTR
ncbi:kinase-like protein [Auricularia subglabra TFB-10046 SS5]|nr:kinase-like protein [Auricularia subglabra TFB-10046 SS5]